MRRAHGFTLVELMVTLAVIAILMTAAVPNILSGVRSARERSVMDLMRSDFNWAHDASLYTDAAQIPLGINAPVGLSGPPTVTFTINADCSYITKIATPSLAATVILTHSMATHDVTAAAPGMSCAGGAGLTLPATITFSAQGTVLVTGTVTATGGSGRTYPMQILFSGRAFRTSPTAGATS